MDYDHDITREEFEQMMNDLSNWGRWGEDDELGAVNLVTPEKVRDAAKLVTEGVTVSMEHPLLTEAAPDNSDPFVHTMTATGENPVLDAYAMDRYEIFYHGYGHTHLDALGHAFWNGKMYNGHPQEEVTEEGAQAMAITEMRNGIVTRGVIVDIPWLKGIPYLEPGTPIYPEDLDAWEQKTGVKIGPRRRGVRADRALGAARGAGSVECRRRIGGAACLDRAVVQGARYRVHRRRRSQRPAAVAGGRRQPAGALPDADRHGHADVR